MIVYDTQSYWILTFSIVRCSWEYKHDVSETGSVSVLSLRGERTHTQLGPLERANLNLTRVIQRGQGDRPVTSLKLCGI
jgi:hypothetical protein